MSGRRIYVITETFLAQDIYHIEAGSKSEAERKFLDAAGAEDRGKSVGIHHIDHGMGGGAAIKTYTASAWDKLWARD